MQDNVGYSRFQETTSPTPAQSRVSYRIESGCTGLYPAGSCQLPKTDTEQFLGNLFHSLTVFKAIKLS